MFKTSIVRPLPQYKVLRVEGRGTILIKCVKPNHNSISGPLPLITLLKHATLSADSWEQ